MEKVEFPKRYNPKDIEEKWYRFWEEKGYFHSEVCEGATPYTIVIPPPNITGILHMGHALNNTIQDILIRWRRMQGYNVLWMPGTDHAGIATQNVVEKKLAKEGKRKEDLGREGFLKEVWNWKEEYGNTIINQLKKMGCSCDWSRTRFTMDEGLSRAVREVFVRLYEKGLIYRGTYIINWCPRCKTALSDEESEHYEREGFLYYIRYPVEGSDDSVVVATTRPETMLGDTAVAVNPEDERYRGLVGKYVILPIVNRRLRVIADDYVDPEFGTGIVKVTPAHDPNDFLIGKRHNLEEINVMNDDGTMNEEAGEYKGLDRFVCREKLLEDLKNKGFFIEQRPHRYAVGHCYRCNTIIEPRISEQWFVRMKELAQPAIRVVEEGRIRFIPERWTKVYLEWMYNIRDWCISRQIWWGHRIPVWYCLDCRGSGNGDNRGIIVSRRQPDRCPSCGSTRLRQDEDVLDTWFSSWLWPFSTMGWPEETAELKFYYPTNTLVTAQEIIFFWVARMIMAGLEFVGDIPFRDVYIHGTVRDDTGRKMSKSLGNIIDPLEIIEEFGADALRFSIINITAQGQDVYLSRHKFETGRNFTNKIWNASRFVLMNIKGTEGLDILPSRDLLSNDDLYIIGKTNRVIQEVTGYLQGYRFKEASSVLYEFFWHDFCDKYIEITKPYLYGEDKEAKAIRQKVLFYVLQTSMRLMHPFIPFITEEIWSRLMEVACKTDAGSIMVSKWPQPYEEWIDERIIADCEMKYLLIKAGRNLRSAYNIEPSRKMVFYIRPVDSRYGDFLRGDYISLCRLLNATDIVIKEDFLPSRPMPGNVSDGGVIYMSLEGIDFTEEIRRLNGEKEKLKEELRRVLAKLNNQEFLNKAPAHVIEKQRNKEKELKDQLDKIEENLRYITGSAGD